jgi:hypothetical protein
MFQRLRAYTSIALLAALPALAQETVASPPKQGRKLNPEQVAQKVETLKAEILPKVWPDKCSTDEMHRRAYFAKWQAVQSDHYLVYTNGPADTVKKFSVTLEELYAFVKKQIPFEDVDHLLTAYIFASDEEYFRFSVQFAGYSEQGARATAGHATAQYYATYYQDPRSPVVFHEATHQIIHACVKVPGVGSWFQEGIAVWFEKKKTNATVEDDIKSDLKHGNCYPLSEFFAIPVLLSDPKGNGHRNYMHAGALLDFMMTTKLAPVAGKFPDFLAAARKGRGFGRGPEVSAELIKVAYGLTVPEFEALWHKHLGVK